MRYKIRDDHPNYELAGRPVRVARNSHECDSLTCYRETGEVHRIRYGDRYVQLSAKLKFCEKSFTPADVVEVSAGHPEPEGA